MIKQYNAESHNYKDSWNKDYFWLKMLRAVSFWATDHLVPYSNSQFPKNIILNPQSYEKSPTPWITLTTILDHQTECNMASQEDCQCIHYEWLQSGHQQIIIWKSEKEFLWDGEVLKKGILEEVWKQRKADDCGIFYYYSFKHSFRNMQWMCIVQNNT